MIILNKNESGYSSCSRYDSFRNEQPATSNIYARAPPLVPKNL